MLGMCWGLGPLGPLGPLGRTYPRAAEGGDHTQLEMVSNTIN